MGEFINMSRVALIGENSLEYIRSLLEIWNNGDCAVLIDWRIPFQTSIQMMNEAGVRSCRIEKKQFGRVAHQLPKEITFLPFEEKKNSAELLSDIFYNTFQPNYTDDEAVVLYSSGTTGKSKGIILSHYAIHKNADSIIDYIKPTINDCIYITKPLSHSSTITGELLVALKSHTKLVIAPTIVPPRFIFQNISKFDVTIMCINPTILQALVSEYDRKKYYIQTLKTLYVSGSVLSDKLYKESHSKLKNIDIYNVYGLSEAGPRVAAQRIDCCISNSVGKPIKGVEVKIIDQNGKPVQCGKKGIVHVNTPSRFNGYIVGNDKNRSLYHEWLNTGDVGFFDIHGELHITDRLDDVLDVGTHKIYPSEIEKIILENSVIESCVVSKVKLGHKDYLCCVYSGMPENISMLKQRLIHILMPYEIPRYWVNCKTIPFSSNGKISKSDIQKLVIKTEEAKVL